MGYFKDEHRIIEGDSEVLETLRNDILDEISKSFSDEDAVVDYSNYVSPVLYGLANMYSCLFIPADGSKEGWTTSSAMDEAREKILKRVILFNAKNEYEKIAILKVVVDEYKPDPEASWITRDR